MRASYYTFVFEGATEFVVDLVGVGARFLFVF